MAVFTSPITRVAVETPRNRVVRVRCPGGLPAFQAGQYVLLGDHGQGIRKPYSIASGPAEVTRTRELEFLIQVGDDGSPGEHMASLSAGRMLDIEGPAGTFMLPGDLHPRAVALIGGGTGIAPLRAMLHHLLEAAPDARLAVLQSARSPDELCFAAEFRALAGAGRIMLTETVTREAPASWSGRRGRVDGAELRELIDGADTWCFVCGPDSLVEGVPRLLAEIGVPGDRIRTEQWADAALAK